MQKRTVLFATPRESLFSEPLARSFNQLGCDVTMTDYRHLRHAQPLFLILCSPILLLLGISSYIFPFIRNAFPIFINFYMLCIVLVRRPNIFFTVKGETLQPWFLICLKMLGVKSVNWFPDDAFQLDRIVTFAKYFDLLFTFDPYLFRLMRKKGFRNVFYLPFATEPSVTYKQYLKKYPIVFVGQPDKARERLLLGIQELGLHVWGPWKNTALASSVVQEHITPKEVEQVYKQAAVTINIHSHSFGDARDRFTEGTNLRTFMGTGTGAFLLAEYRRDLENLFVLGKEIETFRSARELRRKVIYYLHHPELRKKIARAGYLRTKREHTYLHRVKTIVETLDRV